MQRLLILGAFVIVAGCCCAESNTPLMPPGVPVTPEVVETNEPEFVRDELKEPRPYSMELCVSPITDGEGQIHVHAQQMADFCNDYEYVDVTPGDNWSCGTYNLIESDANCLLDRPVTMFISSMGWVEYDTLRVRTTRWCEEDSDYCTDLITLPSVGGGKFVFMADLQIPHITLGQDPPKESVASGAEPTSEAHDLLENEHLR